MGATRLAVLADSDVRVPPRYLKTRSFAARRPSGRRSDLPLHGVPRRGLWSLLGTLFVNEWFIPSVRVAAMSGSRAFAFGATIALRRNALAEIGGFGAIANQLADDYRLGELTRRRGLRTVLSDVVVETSVGEPLPPARAARPELAAHHPRAAAGGYALSRDF